MLKLFYAVCEDTPMGVVDKKELIEQGLKYHYGYGTDNKFTVDVYYDEQIDDSADVVLYYEASVKMYLVTTIFNFLHTMRDKKVFYRMEKTLYVNFYF